MTGEWKGSKRESVHCQKVDRPEPNYWRVWVGWPDHPYCVADGVGRFRARWAAWLLRRILR